MEIMRIRGGAPLRGEVAVSGSKNAALPLMAAALLTDEPVILRNVPDIEDVDVMAGMLRHLGVSVERQEPSVWLVHAAEVNDEAQLSAELTGKLRGSFLLLGALCARTGAASIAKPGGDDIGMRRVEQHLEGLRLLGAEVCEEGGAYVARSSRRLAGVRIDLDMPTVTGTENLMMAATLADGITVISNAAREPHVYDLARCLVGMGARISGAGSDLIVVEGQTGLLHGTDHAVTSDYIEAGTWMLAAAATGGDVVVNGMRPSHVRFLINKLRASGAEVVEGGRHMRVRAPERLRAVDATTWPHPGFATDLQSQFASAMTQADGVSIISEAVYENRFHYVAELNRLGADIGVQGRSAVVKGRTPLHGGDVRIRDIRSGAALVIAALCAEGESRLTEVYHLDRGYEDLDEKLVGLGGQVERVAAGDPAGRRDLSGVVGD